MECYAAIRIEGAKRLFQKEAWDQTLRHANSADISAYFQEYDLTERNIPNRYITVTSAPVKSMW